MEVESYYIIDHSLCSQTDSVEKEEGDSDSSGRRIRNVAQVKDSNNV